MEALLRPVMSSTSSRPAATASSTTYWIAGLSTTGSISFGVALVAGRNLVPRPAAGMTALVTGALMRATLVVCQLPRDAPAVTPVCFRGVESEVGGPDQRPGRV